MEIERKLKTPVRSSSGIAAERSAGQLAKLADVNLHLDPKGLAEEGVSSDTPVTIDLTQESR